MQNITLPGIAISSTGQQIAQGVPFDHFDFQGLDPKTGRLFISHAGPSAAKEPLAKKQLPAGTQFQSQIVVFDTKQQTVISTIAIPDVHGVAVASDLNRVYVGDATDDRIYVIDATSLKAIGSIALDNRPCATQPCEKPDAITYDAVDHKIFVSDAGNDPAHQDIGVIDTRTNRLVDRILLGQDRWGDAIAHSQYDPVSHHLFVVVQPQGQPLPASTQASSNKGPVLPVAHLVTINPGTDQVISTIRLPDSPICSDAHGLVIDAAQHVGFIACVATHTLLMINLQSMHIEGSWSVEAKPDILQIDLSIHRLYVPGASGISIFDESGAAQGVVKKLGDFLISATNPHTVAVDPNSHNLYFPVLDPKNKPLLQIERYGS